MSEDFKNSTDENLKDLVKIALLAEEIVEIEKIRKAGPIDFEAIQEDILKDNNFILKLMQESKFNALRFLIDNGLDLNRTVSNGMTILGWAVASDENLEHRCDFIEYCIENGGDPSHVCNGHPHILLEALCHDLMGVPLYLIERMQSKDDFHGQEAALTKAVKDAQNPEISKAFFAKKADFLRVANGQARYKKVDSQEIEVIKRVSGGVTLSEVYNFRACRRENVASSAAGLSVTYEDFSDIKSTSAIKEAAEKLVEFGGTPGDQWQKALGIVVKQVEKPPFKM